MGEIEGEGQMKAALPSLPHTYTHALARCPLLYLLVFFPMQRGGRGRPKSTWASHLFGPGGDCTWNGTDKYVLTDIDGIRMCLPFSSLRASSACV